MSAHGRGPMRQVRCPTALPYTRRNIVLPMSGLAGAGIPEPTGTYRSIEGFNAVGSRRSSPGFLTSAAAISNYPADRDPACILPQPGFLPFHPIQPSSRALSLASFHARVRKADRLIEVRLSSLSAMRLASS